MGSTGRGIRRHGPKQLRRPRHLAGGGDFHAHTAGQVQLQGTCPGPEPPEVLSDTTASHHCRGAPAPPAGWSGGGPECPSPPAWAICRRRLRCCTQLAKLRYFTPCRAANFMPESPLRSNESNRASRCANGVRTRPSPSVFKIIDSGIVDVIGHTYDTYAIL